MPASGTREEGPFLVDRSGKVHARQGESPRGRPRPFNHAKPKPAPLPDDPALRGYKTAKLAEGGEERDSQWQRSRHHRPGAGHHPKSKPSRERQPERGKGARKKGPKTSRDFEASRAPKSKASKFRALKLKATVDKNHKGFAFLLFDDRNLEDAFVPPRDAETLFHGDRVEVSVAPDGEVVHIEVLEHRFKELVGRFSPHLTRVQAKPGEPRSGWVTYERKSAREEVFIPELSLNPRVGDWVRARLKFHKKGPFKVTAEVLEVYGEDLPARIDVAMIAAEYNLTEEHSEAAEREARSFHLEVPGKDLQGREDLREVPFITIDGENARDFDDAVYVERKKSGYVLWVGIADVSHYVKPGSALYQEAKSRGTSVYFPERAFHMLPSALATNLCSLRPLEPRLALVSKVEFDRTGAPIGTEILEAVIESKRRATYNEIQEEAQANERDPEWEYAPHFELYRLLRRKRRDRGSIDFDLPEAEVSVDESGEPLSIVNRERLDSHRLIEEFMISANEAVTEWIMERGWPFIYRVHEEPSEVAMEKFQSLAATVGVRVALGDGIVSPKILADVVRRLEGHPAQDLLNMALLRSMKQAIYSSTHGIHYGLASQAYTHFTSPIRRFPDLIVHQLLRRAVRVERRKERPLRNQERDELEATLEEIAEHCSYRERLAANADREAIKLKQVRLMRKHLGDEFEGKVIGMADAGLFVQLNDPFVEGLVSKNTMNDDFYEFNEDRMIFFGRRKKRTFKIGDPVRVRVIRADIDRRQIDFGLV